LSLTALHYEQNERIDFRDLQPEKPAEDESFGKRGIPPLIEDLQ
jgi:hypothetical protein